MTRRRTITPISGVDGVPVVVVDEDSSGRHESPPPIDPTWSVDRLWKVCILVGAILAAGWGAALYMGRFAYAEDLEKVQTQQERQDAKLEAIGSGVRLILERLNIEPPTGLGGRVN